MSAAEPADPTRPVVNAMGVGAVIDINRRRRGGAHQAVQGRWTTMATPPPGPDHIPPAEESLRLWAEDAEKSFLEIHHTLTDDDTAVVYQRTLDLVVKILEGSHAGGIIDRDQLDKLAASIRWMKEAPRLV